MKPNPKDTDTELDGIFVGLFSDSGYMINTEAVKAIKVAKASIIQWHRREMLKVIGEDDIDETDTDEKINRREYLMFLMHRNNLRAEQRKAVDTIKDNMGDNNG